MNIKYSKIILFMCFVLGVKSINASEEGLFSYLGTIRSYIPSYLMPNTTSEELPACFQRTGYVPVELGMNSPELLAFDLSDENISRMEMLLYNTQSLEQEKNESLSVLLMQRIKPQLEYYGYNPDPHLTKSELVLDSYCVLAKNGYGPVFNKLYNTFQNNKRLSFLFRSNSRSVSLTETMREYKGYLLRSPEKDIDEEEDDTTNAYRSSDSTDELSDGFDVEKKNFGKTKKD